MQRLPLFLWLVLFFTAVTGTARDFQAQKETVWKLSFSNDGYFFLSAGGEGTVNVWWPDCLCHLTTFTHPSNFTIYDAIFLPDNSRAMSTSLDGSVFIWDRESGKTIQKLEGHSTYVAKLAANEDGSRLYTVGTDDYINTWDSQTYKVLARYKTHSPVGIVSLPNTLLTTSLAGIQKWDETTGKSVSFSDSEYFFAAAGVDAERFLVGGKISEGSALQLRSVSEGSVVRTFDSLHGSIWTIAVSSDKKWVAASAYEGETNVWELETGKLVYHSGADLQTVSVAFIPGSDAILLGTSTGHVYAIPFLVGKLPTLASYLTFP